jgi:hypothetical protein
MYEKTMEFDETGVEVLACTISDEALETAAGSWREKPGSITLAYCSGLSTCPAVAP